MAALTVFAACDRPEMRDIAPGETGGQKNRRKAYHMANTVSAKKATRKIAKRMAVNTARRSRIRTFIRKVEEAIASGDKEAAQNALRAVQPELMRAVTRGVMHKNTVSRKMSRLSSRVKAISA